MWETLVKQYYYATDTMWNFYRLIIRTFEFCFVLFISLYILKVIGFKIPEETFGERNKSNSRIETDIRCEKSVPFGDIDICLPYISKMIECYSNPIVKSKVDKTGINSTLVLGVYLNIATYQKVDKLNEIALDDYFIVFKYVDVKNLNLDKEIDEATGYFDKKSWPDMKKSIQNSNFSFERPILIEKYFSNEKSRSGVILSKIQSVTGEESFLIMIMNLTQIKEKIIMTVYYTKYEGEVSIKNGKIKSDYFSHLMIDDNK